MSQLKITCESCCRSWIVRSSFSLYERQAIESRPCPLCGACTLTCPDPSEVAASAAAGASFARTWRPAAKLIRR